MTKLQKEKLFSNIASVNVGQFYFRLDELLAIADEYDGQIYLTAADAFLYGFLKGQRAAKAERKRKENKS